MKITIPKYIMGKPIEGSLERALASASQPPVQHQNSPVSTPVNISTPEKYAILPGKNYSSVFQSYPDTLISLERTHNGKNWTDTQKALFAEGNYMPTIRQFVDFVKLLKSGNVKNGKGQIIDGKTIQATLDDIFKLGNYRGRWLDADFKVVNGKLHMNYGHTIKNGNLIYSASESLTDSTLMDDRKPGIDLTDWINRATNQGLPPSDVKKGDIWYYKPLTDNKSVARFYADSVGAGLDCGRFPSSSDSSLGVNAARKILRV